MKEVAAFIILTLVGTCFARADIFDFSFTGSGLQGQGIFTATFNSAANDFLVTGVSGEVNGSPITGLLAATGTGNSYYYPTPNQYFFYDDLISNTPTPAVDDPGILFTVQGFASPVNLFNRGTSTNPINFEGVFSFGISTFVNTPVSLTLTNATASPEPPTLGLLAVLLAFTGAWRLRSIFFPRLEICPAGA